MLALFVTALVLAGAASNDDAFDIEDEIELNPPANYRVPGKSCPNSLAFALVGAMEIAYTKETGDRIKFAEQELIDCFHSGCNRPHITDYVAWLKTVDRLAPASKYAPYSASQEVCRSALSPDGLDKIKLTGELVTVTPENFEESIRKYGSILACYDTRVSSIRSSYMPYDGGLVTGKPSTTCTRYVLIVGYNATTYRAREIFGKEWGNDGYMIIKRGGNNCGIEHNMHALVTEERTEPKNLDLETGCPADFPEYCVGTRTCARESQDCVEEEEKECEDSHHACKSTYKKYCTRSSYVQNICPKTCGKCAEGADPYRGKCYIPSIENGIVMNADMLDYEEVLEVECDEGFVLVGAPNTCIIQNVYGPDSRIIQECIKVGSETFTAQGFDYRGSKHTTLDGEECESWNDIAFKGKYHHHGRIYPVDFVNHNFCRNVVDEEDDEAEPVPYCFVGGRLEYCFVFPGCSGTCEDAVDEDPAEDCADIKLCEFSDKSNVNRQKAYWKYCTATCCAAAGC